MLGHRPRVGAGSPAKGPDLLANFHPPFIVAAATVFAGKPAPTQIGGGHTYSETAGVRRLAASRPWPGAG
ncbi:hypothetical protein C4Q27_21120 [Pseudomonas sp. SWI36]|nr:hypothetical protein C4Q27_21120 [Pseudomonas sp. SWI36]